MLWLRKGIVHILAVLLLVALLGVSAATAFNINLGQPTKVEGWVAESHLYDHVVDQALSNVETGGGGTASSIAYSSPQVKKAANTAFSPQFIQQSANTFLDANYAWLQGKTATPDFTIDLRVPKQNFAKLTGQQVESHLLALPECSTTQLAGFQLPVDPLTVECKPPTLNPKTEAARVTKEVNDSDAFITNPVIHASSIGDNGKNPYYKQLSKAPKYYRLGMQLPLIFTGVILVAMLGIVVIAPSRRKGLRRVAYMLLDAGVILIVLKYLLDSIMKAINRHVSDGTLSGELHKPFIAILDKVTSGIIHIGFYFGIAFVAVAVLLFGYLLVTMKRKPKSVQPAGESAPQPAQATEQAPVEPDFSEEKPAVDAATVQLTPSRRKPAMDIMAPKKPKTIVVSEPAEAAKKPPKPRRRLVQ